jgi:hypothetical protein
MSKASVISELSRFNIDLNDDELMKLLEEFTPMQGKVAV